jgi:uncharacterized alpha-E superfamily protein
VSESAPETPATPPEGTDPPKAQSLEELLADLDDDRRKAVLGQVDKARNEAKNLRDRLKKAEPLAAQYEQLEQASKTDQERAEETRKGLEERAQKAVQRVARAEVKAALAGVVDDPDEILDDLNLAKFIDTDGEVDQDAITALRDKYARRFPQGPRTPRPDTSQASGARGSTPASPANEFASLLQGLTRR